MFPPPVAPYRVEYFCPRQSQYWQRAKTPTPSYPQAVAWCFIVKPPRGSARIIDATGRQIFII